MLFRFKRRTASVPLPWCARQAPQVSDRSDCESSCTSALTAERRKGQIMYNVEATAARIKELRLDQSLTQEEFADILGITLRYQQRMEGASRSIPIELLAEISEKFGVSLDYLVLGKEIKHGVPTLEAELDNIILRLQAIRTQL